MSDLSVSAEPTSDLKAAADWVREEHDGAFFCSIGEVYRRGRWLATFTEDDVVLAVSAYKFEQQAVAQLLRINDAGGI